MRRVLKITPFITKQQQLQKSNAFICAYITCTFQLDIILEVHVICMYVYIFRSCYQHHLFRYNTAIFNFVLSKSLRNMYKSSIRFFVYREDRLS